MSTYENISLLNKAEVLGKIRDEAIDRLAERLMETKEFNPFTPANLAEAFSEMDEKNLERLSYSLKYDAIDTWEALSSFVELYWETKARLEAMDRIRNQLAHACVRCGGIGCMQCNEDEARENYL